MSDLAISQFSEMRIDDRARLQPLLMAANKLSCDYNFANLYSWGEIFGLRWCFYREGLFIYSARDDVLLMPVGQSFGVTELLGVSDLMIRQGKSGNFVLFDADYVERHEELGRYFTATIDNDNADYVYSSQALVELKGNKLHKKKNLLSQFLRNNPDYRCEELTPGHAHDCFLLAEKWCQERNCEIIGFEHETSALKRSLDKFRELELEGIVMKNGEAMVAFSIFDRQNSDTASVHFEKYDGSVKGSAQAINWETARHLAGRYTYINREQDLGIEGLRRAKESYCPAFKVKTYKLDRIH